MTKETAPNSFKTFLAEQMKDPEFRAAYESEMATKEATAKCPECGHGRYYFNKEVGACGFDVEAGSAKGGAACGHRCPAALPERDVCSDQAHKGYGFAGCLDCDYEWRHSLGQPRVAAVKPTDRPSEGQQAPDVQCDKCKRWVPQNTVKVQAGVTFCSDCQTKFIDWVGEQAALESEGQQVAPERIWVQPNEHSGLGSGYFYKNKPVTESVEYVRADLHTVSDAGEAQQQAREIVRTIFDIFDNTTASPEALKRTMIERITAALSTRSAAQSAVHRCPHFEPKGEDSGGAYNAKIIADVTKDLLDQWERPRINGTRWYQLRIKDLIQRIANLRVMLATTRQASTGREWDKAIRVAGNVMLSHDDRCNRETRDCKCASFTTATKIREALKAARNLDTSEADNYSDER